MKRALAERAKQSLPQQQQQQQPLPSSASSSPEQPPQKLPRLQVSTTTKNAVASSPSKTPTPVGSSSQTTTSSLQQQQQRKQRIQSLTSAVRQDDDNDASFYLKHQNRALATELQSLQFAVQQLEQERDTRRQHCWSACQALQSLQATWTQLETALTLQQRQQLQQQQNSTLEAALTTPASSSSLTPPETATTNVGTVSTGTGTTVEWTRALALALAALGATPEGEKQPCEDPLYTDLSQLSANVASRASVLQDAIWKVVVQRQEETTATTHDSNGNADPNNSGKTLLLLETQVAELAAARDAIAARERKLRRNLYRLASGMLTIEQIMTSTTMGDAGAADAAAALQQEAVNAVAAVKTETTITSAPDHHDETATSVKSTNAAAAAAAAATTTTTTAEVEALRTRIADLETSVSNRETTIQDVRV